MKIYLENSIRGHLILTCALACFAFSPTALAVCQNGCDGTTRSTFLGENASYTTPAAERTRQSVLILSCSTRPPTATRRAVQMRSQKQHERRLQHGHGQGCALTSIQPGSTTLPPVLVHSLATQRATAIRPTVLVRSLTTKRATATRPPVFRRFLDNTGSFNTASGVLALSGNTYGGSNTAAGHNALSSNTTGSFNIALGADAGGNLTTGNNNIDIANRGVAAEADTIRIGTRGRHTNTFIAGINGVTVAEGGRGNNRFPRSPWDGRFLVSVSKTRSGR